MGGMPPADLLFDRATTDGFTWRDGDRVIRFGPDAIDDAPALLGEGYTLITTARSLPAAPALAERAAHVHELPDGYVEDTAGALLDEVEGELLVALGGGRVVDTTKALGAARGIKVAAIPTTLSAAEMTWVHRQARGADPSSGHARARIVINDPALSASQPLAELAASAGNSLGHAVDGACTTLATPVPTMVAQEAARLLALALPEAAEPDRVTLALGALLSGWAIDSTWYGLHHVCAQTLVRVGPAGHGPANVCLLRHTAAALRRRSPAVLDALDAAIGVPVEAVAARFAALAGAEQLEEMGVELDALERCAQAAGARAELDLTPPRPDHHELLAIYEAAW
jgi:alcohol dehydrogenase class IV